MMEEKNSYLERCLTVSIPNTPLAADDAVTFAFADPFLAVEGQTGR